MDEVRYGLLGPMEVTVDGAPVKLPGTAERALLAQLLLSPGRTIAATMLVDRLWSESACTSRSRAGDESAARSASSVAASRAAEKLGTDSSGSATRLL